MHSLNHWQIILLHPSGLQELEIFRAINGRRP